MQRKKIVALLLFTVLLLTSCNDKITSSSNVSSSNDVVSSSEVNSSIQSEINDSSIPESSGTISEDITSYPSDIASTEITSDVSNEVSSEEDETVHPYYTSISQMTFGITLLSDVRSLITNTHHTLTTYKGLASIFKKSDADPDKSGNVLWFYTGTSKSFSSFSGSVGQTNREHVWPKDAGKAFPAESRAGSDAHHLRPMEVQLNSIRGSKSFGVVEQKSSNIAKQGESTTYATGDYLAYTNSTYFYPAKGYRGQTARILFYVQARWGSENNLKFVLGAGKSKTIGDIETLMRWHLEEPVSPLEEIRNEEIYKVQGNRNPFIDMPEYACKIYAHDGQSYNTKLQNVCNV